eukprot:4168361-Amphidinium_carterae.1
MGGKCAVFRTNGKLENEYETTTSKSLTHTGKGDVAGWDTQRTDLHALIDEAHTQGMQRSAQEAACRLDKTPH